MRYLLDTNILSDLVRNPRGIVARRLRRTKETRVCTSIIVAGELRFGAAKRGSARLRSQLEAILEVVDIVPFDAPMDVVYASTRLSLEEAGQPIGGNDLLIAAQALALGYTLVTDNEREFNRVEGLAVENWLRDP